jgi:hypothetical protein
MEVDVDDLAEWLRLKARIHDRIIGKTVQTLEDLEVFEVCDLLALRGIRPLNEVFAEVTAKKISDALAQLSLGKADGATPATLSAPGEATGYVTPQVSSASPSAASFDSGPVAFLDAFEPGPFALGPAASGQLRHSDAKRPRRVGSLKSGFCFDDPAASPASGDLSFGSAAFAPSTGAFRFGAAAEVGGAEVAGVVPESEQVSEVKKVVEVAKVAVTGVAEATEFTEEKAGVGAAPVAVACVSPAGDAVRQLRGNSLCQPPAKESASAACEPLAPASPAPPQTSSAAPTAPAAPAQRAPVTYTQPTGSRSGRSRRRCRRKAARASLSTQSSLPECYRWDTPWFDAVDWYGQWLRGEVSAPVGNPYYDQAFMDEERLWEEQLHGEGFTQDYGLIGGHRWGALPLHFLAHVLLHHCTMLPDIDVRNSAEHERRRLPLTSLAGPMSYGLVPGQPWPAGATWSALPTISEVLGCMARQAEADMVWERYQARRFSPHQQTSTSEDYCSEDDAPHFQVQPHTDWEDACFDEGADGAYEGEG